MKYFNLVATFKLRHHQKTWQAMKSDEREVGAPSKPSTPLLPSQFESPSH